MESRLIKELLNPSFKIIDSRTGAVFDKYSFDFSSPKNKGAAFLQCKNNPETLFKYLSFLNTNWALILLGQEIPKNIYEKYNIIKEVHPDLALCLTTSGSIGDPKLVRLSEENIISNTKAIVKTLRITKDDVVITTLPFHHAYGLSIIHSHLMAGATIILNEDSIVTPQFWDKVKRYNVTTFNGVPWHYQILDKLIKKGELKNRFPYLKMMTQAGGPLKQDIRDRFTIACFNNKAFFYVMYGQTEATARISILRTDPSEKVLSVGKPIQGRIATADDDEIIYEGSNVFMGYACNSSDLSLGNENNGLLYTGDLGVIDNEGYVYITGRKSRFVKINGERINLDYLEENLKGNDFAIIGKDDLIKICWVNVAPTGLNKFNLHPSNYKFYQVNKIPRTETGKVRYGELKKIIKN